MKKVILLLFVWAGLLSQTYGQAKKSVTRSGNGKTAVKVDSLKTSMTAGELIYNQYCAVCHQPDGDGVPHLNPPLIETEYVLGEKPRIIQVLLKGLSTHEPINGTVYSNVMPSHSFLTDEQIANVLTFVRNSFGNKASAVSTAEVTAERAKK